MKAEPQIKQFISKTNWRYLLLLIKAVRVRDFNIFLQVVLHIQFKRASALRGSAQLTKLAIVEKLFYLFDYTAMKLLAMGQRESRLSVKSEKDIIR
jgi:hypothetical protein